MALPDFIDYSALINQGKKAVNGVSSIFDDPNDQAKNLQAVQNADVYRDAPSTAAFAAMSSLGINPYTNFAQQYAIDAGKRLNNAFDILGAGSQYNVGDDDTRRAQFMLDYSKALLQGPSNPLYVDYNEVGQQLQQMLAGGVANMGGQDIKSLNAVQQVQAITDYINSIGFQAMSPERMQLIQSQLGKMYAGYSVQLASGGTDTDFLGYLVQNSADFLDMFFGAPGRQWSYTEASGPTGTPTTIGPGGNGGNDSGALYQGQRGGQVTRYTPAYGLPGTPVQNALGNVTYIDGKPYYASTFDSAVNSQQRNFPYRSDY